MFYEDSFILGNDRPIADFYDNNLEGLVPSGVYQLCVRLRPSTLNQQLVNTLSNLGCSSLTFQQYNPPLINQINGTICGGITPELQSPNVPFPVSFTPPVFSLNNITVTDFRYIIRIFELLDNDGRDPNQILQALQDRNEAAVWTVNKELPNGTVGPLIVEQLMPQDFISKLELGHNYVISIQAISNTGDPLPNDGYSPICRFTYNVATEEPEKVVVLDDDLPEACKDGNCGALTENLTGGTPHPTFQKGETFRIGCFKVLVDDPATKKGFVTIPFFSAKFAVSFSGVTVQQFGNKLIATSGKVIGLKDNKFPSGIVSDLYEAFKTADTTITETTEALPAPVSAILQDEIAQIDNTTDNINTAFQAILTTQRFIEQVGNSDFETGLPAGIENDVDGRPLRVGIFGMTFETTKATMHVIVQTPPIPGVLQQLYFGGSNICFSPSNASIKDATFYLGGDLSFPIAGGHKLRLTGTHTNGEANSGTFIKLKDWDFEEINIAGKMEINNDIFIPKPPATGKVEIAFTGNATNNFDGLILTSTAETPVALANFKSFGFVLKEVSLDLSTTKNPTGLTGSELADTWTGIHVKRAGIVLPSDFNLGNVARSPSLTVKDLLIGFDEFGVSFNAALGNFMTLNDGGSLGGLGFSIDSLNMKMVSNNIDAFYLKGKLRFGLFDAGTHEGALPYKIDILDLINRNGNSGGGSGSNGDLALALDMTLNENVDLTISKLHTTFTLGSSSRVEYNSGGLDGVADRKLRFKLHGGISIVADDVNLPGMHFENFVFEGHDLKLDQFKVGFSSPQKTAGGVNTEDGTKAGGFPISIEGFHPILGAGTNGGLIKFGFGFDIILNLKEGAGFGLTTAIDITTELDRDFKPTLEIDVAFKKISIVADVSVAKISGFLAFIKEEGNKGFQGCITVAMKVPAPIRGQLQAMFGTRTENGESYRYFYIEGSISGIQGIIIPSTPIGITGFAGGFWYNMIKSPNAPSFAARLNAPPTNGECVPPQLVPQKEAMGIGLGVMFEEVASQGYSFNGAMSFEAQLTTDLAPLTFEVAGAVRFVKIPGPAVVGSVTAITDPIKIAADIRLGYDFTQNVLFGDFNVYLKIGEIIKGAGPNERAGRMVMYFGRDDWYVYFGNPWGNEGLKNNDLAGMGRYAGVSMSIPKIGEIGQAGMYFCMGTHGIRQVTELPPGFSEYIDNSGSPQFDPRASSGTGVAFGAYLKGDIKIGETILGVGFGGYLKFGFGFDLALVKYLSGQCGRNINDFGINGYYATGQIYGYVDGGLVVKYDGEDYPIATIKLTAHANFGGPNPTWIVGTLNIDRESFEGLIIVAANAVTGGGYAVADGAVKVLDAGADAIGDLFSGEEVDLEESWDEAKGITERIVDLVAPSGLKLKLELGDICEGNFNKEASFDDRENSRSIISYILPQVNSGETTPKLEPYQSISVQFSRPINETWEIIKPDGTVLKRRWYIKTVEIKRGEGGTILPHDFVDISTTEYKYWIRYASNAQPLGSGATVRFKIVLGLKEKVGNGEWIPKLTYTTGTGNRTTDDVKTQTFEIVPINYELSAADVKFSYPLVGQNYFLQNHGAKFIVLNKFLPEFANLRREDLITKTYSNSNLVGEGTFKYSKINYAESAFEYNTPTLPNEANIKVEFYVRRVVVAASANSTNGKSNSTTNRQSDIVSSSLAGNIGLIPTELVKVYTLSFKTSKFNSFPEKMASTRSTPFFHPSPDSYIMNKRFMFFDEGWDGFEVGRTSPTNSVYNNLVENSNGSRTYLGHFVSSATVTMSTPWHTAMKDVVEREYNNGDAYSNAYWFRTQTIGTDLVEGNNVDVTFEQHEAIRSEMRYPERLIPPTAGNYEFTFEYQYPVLERGVVKHFTQNAQPTTSTTQIGGNFTSIQIFTLPQSSTIYKTTVAYEGMQATLAKQQTAIKNGIQTVQKANTNEIKLRGR